MHTYENLLLFFFYFYGNLLKKCWVENVVQNIPISEVLAGMGHKTSNPFDGWGVRVRTDLFSQFFCLWGRGRRYKKASAGPQNSKWAGVVPDSCSSFSPFTNSTWGIKLFLNTSSEGPPLMVDLLKNLWVFLGYIQCASKHTCPASSFHNWLASI